MPENLLSETTVHLFGRAVDDLTLDTGSYGTGLIADAVKRGRTLARIYAFSFQNEFVDLTSPALFLVPGEGSKVEETLDGTGLARIPDELNPTLTVWTVERGDLTIRLDVMAGTFDSVLLDYELADDGLKSFVRGGEALGTPSPMGLGGGKRRRRRWRSDDE
jgi:hypothetical protein